ncbi:competence protein ComFC [Apilactobacillus kunkeei]|uniref:Competence protein ComFC n=2 Tax=Apilactobacillus kunkeei TaxID=148814 RepID=A0A1L8CHT5_9LACO|nr:competence protein ComFC [Apilactobacillus kunkeei]
MDSCLLCNKSMIYDMSLSFLLSFKRLPKRYVCVECMNQFARIDETRICKACGRQMDKSGVCIDCQKWRQLGDDFVNESIFQYNDAMKDFMHRYKFVGDYQLRMIFQKEIRKKIRKDLLIVPIPVSSETKINRGFNQVIGLLGDIEYVEALMVKEKRKVRQSELNRQQRIHNKQIFTIDPKNASQIVDQKILLVDDIYTTGTTIRHAASVLRKNGAKQVLGLTLCR